MNFQRKPLPAGLYFVSTPIGSARDITLRALDILASADVIASEDTRTTRKLMDIHGIPLDGRKVIAHHDHSGPAAVQGLVDLVSSGKSLAYVSEAGTPLIADPGFELGRAMAEAGLPVTAAPGPVAAVCALSISGLSSDKFLFAGFLPSGKSQRDKALAELRDLPFTIIFYESPKRIQEMLASLADIMGPERESAVCRELTKKFEEVRRGTIADLIEAFDGRTVKGEIVVLVGRKGAAQIEDVDVDAALRAAMQTMRLKDAATAVSGALGLPRRQVYQRALDMDKDAK